jgi:CSLREA domain-containing protein
MRVGGAVVGRLEGRAGTVGTACALAVSVICLAFASAAFGRTFTVTRTDDPAPSRCTKGDCSLREAIAAAEGHPGADAIDFSNDVDENTIDLMSGELLIRGDLTISGTGASRLKVSGGYESRIFHMTGGHITIRDIAIRDGRETASASGPHCPNSSSSSYMLGGGILQDAGSLKLDGVRVNNNSVRNPAGNGILGGGGIAVVDGKLLLTHSWVALNQVLGGATSIGGGITNCVGAVTITKEPDQGLDRGRHRDERGSGRLDRKLGI